MMIWLLGCVQADRVVTVEIGDAIATIDARFLSVAVDSGQVAGTVFWSEDPDEEPESAVPPYDFTRPELVSLTQALGPMWLRLGGTDADRLYYDLGEDLAEPPEGYRGTLTQDQLQGAVAFADAVDASLFFTLNAGPSARDDQGAWDPSNSQALLEWAAATDAPIGLWELGNELNGFLLFHGESVSSAQYGADLRALAALRDAHTPDALVAGPSSAYWPVSGELVPYMQDALADGGDALDVVTWHYYPQQSERCPVQNRLAEPRTMLATDALDEGTVWAAEVEAHRDASAPHADVWLGETGNAQCGGQPGVSDAWAGSFWWLDQLGWAAARGQPVVVRQTLSGSDYGLLDDATLTPNPDYWVSVLHKELMGPTVLDVHADGLRVYGHCTAGQVVLSVVNPSAETVALDVGRAEVWLLEADDLGSRTVRLNGVTLTAPGGVVPALEPVVERPVFPPLSLGFVRLDQGC